jgi:hypothetical protein
MCLVDPFIFLTDIIVWSNFEIGDMDLWRGEAYTKFFEFLDKKGGFHYEVRSSTPSTMHSTLTPAPSAGETHPCIASAPPFSLEKTRYISSTTLATGTNRSSIVHRARHTRRVNAGVIRRTTSVCIRVLPGAGRELNHSS